MVSYCPRTVSAWCALVVAAGLCHGPAEAADAGPLTIYNSQDEGPVETLAAAFEKKTGTRIVFRNNGAPALAQQIAQEGERTPADIFYAEYSSALVSLADKGLLSPLPADVVKAIPSQFDGAKGDWVGTTARSFVVIYNRKQMTEGQVPASILDFAEPQWADKFAFNPRAAAFLELVVAVENDKGRAATLEWLKGMKANGKAFPKNTAMVLAVDRGEVPMAINADNYWLAIAREKGADSLDARVHYIGKKDPGALLTVSGIGIPKYAPHKAEAEAFVSFAVSEEEQKILADAAGDVPLRPGVTAPVALKPFSDLDPPPVTAAEIGDASGALALEREAGIN